MVTYLILGVSFEGRGKPLPYWLSGDVSSTIRKVYEIATPACPAFADLPTPAEAGASRRRERLRAGGRNAYLSQAGTSASRHVVPLLRSGLLAMTYGLTEDE
jgi:hypothetical protein